MGKDIILSVKDLNIIYEAEHGDVHAVNGVSFDLYKGETIGLVGETGAGKTSIALGITRLLPDPPGKVKSGEIFLENQNILNIKEKEMRKIRGAKISMIFQDPMTALNPAEKVGAQIAEVISLHERVSRAEARSRAEKTLELVGIPKDRYDEVPYQFSGGMKQRVVIAIALACNPDLLIADEPTTALDVTIQAQILELMNKIKLEKKTSNIMITHDLGVVAEMCERVIIIYAGQIVETGTVRQVFKNPGHPYTRGLLGSVPDINETGAKRLKPVRGMMPDPTNLPVGCKFAPRCDYATKECNSQIPMVSAGDGHEIRCINIKSLGGEKNACDS